MGLDWKKMGREKLTAHLEQSLERIGEEQQKLAKKSALRRLMKWSAFS